MEKAMWKIPPEGENGFRQNEISFMPTNEKPDLHAMLARKMKKVNPNVENLDDVSNWEHQDTSSNGSRMSQSECSNGPVSCVLSV